MEEQKTRWEIEIKMEEKKSKWRKKKQDGGTENEMEKWKKIKDWKTRLPKEQRTRKQDGRR